jgi:hypothetical protein
MIARVLRRGTLPFCLLTTLLGLAACGDLPEPFLGNPGATARRLAKPPAPLLAVTPGTDTLLSDQANKELADEVAKALQQTEVPAMVRTAPEKTDWRLITRATQTNNMVNPEFSVLDPEGKEEGKAAGEPVPVAEWASASPELLHRIAAEAAPRVGAMLTGIRIAHEKADPNSLYNRPAKVMVADVTGAPGDGNAALTRQMRARLAVLGPVVLTTPTDADFIVQGKVAVTPLPQHKERVEIQWSVNVPSGDERGKVIQLNEIPAGTLSQFWGDVAVVVASEASNGINDVIRRQSDKEPASAQQPKGSGPVSALPAGQVGSAQPVSAPAAAGLSRAGMLAVHPAVATRLVATQPPVVHASVHPTAAHAPAARGPTAHGPVAQSAAHAPTAKPGKQTIARSGTTQHAAAVETANTQHPKTQASVQ